MFTVKFGKNESTKLEIEIDRLFAKLANLEPETGEYDKVSEQLDRLYNLKDVDSKRLLSRDTMLAAATNIAGILVITNYEYAHALGSKGLAFVMKNIK